MSPGRRMERLRVFSSMGGLGPRSAVVRSRLRSLESSTTHSKALSMLEETTKVMFAFPSKMLLYGRLSFSTSGLVLLLAMFLRVRSTGAYKLVPLNFGTSVVFTCAKYDASPIYK